LYHYDTIFANFFLLYHYYPKTIEFRAKIGKKPALFALGTVFAKK